MAERGDHHCGDLLIGLGNPLRGDDGVGRQLAQWAAGVTPALRVRIVQQLTPELAEELAAVRRVLFVDASLLPASGRDQRSLPCLRALPPPGPSGADLGEAGAFSHRLDPPQLLAITALLHGRAPQAWLLLLPAFRLKHSEGLSAELSSRLPEAKALLRRWCDDRSDASGDDWTDASGGDGSDAWGDDRDQACCNARCAAPHA